MQIAATFALAGLGGCSQSVRERDDRVVRMRTIPSADLASLWPAAQTREVGRVLTRAGETAAITEHHAEAGYLITVPGGGHHLVDPDGRSIRSAVDGIPPAWWQAAVAAHGLPLAATLQGIELFHASAVVIAGQVVGLMGGPATGKSTLAARLIQLGARFFADDMIALEMQRRRLVVHAGLGVVRLGPFAQTAVPSLAAQGLRTLREGDGRTVVELNRDVATLPLRSLYMLRPAPRDADAAVTTEIPDPLRLLSSTCNLSVREPERLRRQFETVSLLGSQARIFNARLPIGGDRELARAIFEHAACEVLR
jgi:hypothetical protein